jgi:hypothetical protein
MQTGGCAAGIADASPSPNLRTRSNIPGWPARAGRFHRLLSVPFVWSTRLMPGSASCSRGCILVGMPDCVSSLFSAPRSASRARDRLDMTVPIGMPMASASSRYDRPSSSRSTSSSRKRSGTLRIARASKVASSDRSSSVSGSDVDRGLWCCCSSNGSVSASNRWPRQPRQVLRTILRNQARPSPPVNVRKYRKARNDASCTTSSASCSFRISQRASRRAASRWGTTTSSKLAPIVVAVAG